MKYRFKNNLTQGSWLIMLGVGMALTGSGLWFVRPRLPVMPDPLRHLPGLTRYHAPQLLSFAELKELSAHPEPSGALKAKYDALFKEPTVSNEAYFAGTRPKGPTSPQLGPYLRVVTWNIEKSVHMPEAIAAFTDPHTFEAQLSALKAPPGSPRRAQALAERALLEQADVILLQEMDLGVKRSGYLDAARELARALRMNYAYLPEYLEIDPVLLGAEQVRFDDGQVDPEATAHYAADAARYKGLFGCAVLSRYPIVHAEGRPLQTQGYDWYAGEQHRTTFLERARRLGAKTVFLEQQTREMKVGGRTYFRVDLRVPQLPEGRLSIINIHLEIKCTPAARAAQIREILGYIKQIKHPVIMAGDFNSAPQDLSPTSTPRVVWRQVKTPEFWMSRAIDSSTPYAFAINVGRFFSNLTKNYQNPTAAHIPVIAPNRVRPLFTSIEHFRFADGGAFDFRGDRERSAHDTGTLSNANERDRWAYATTFRVDRTIANVVGKYRLDWFFVKSYLKKPSDRRRPYRFAPHFGRTLSAVNAAREVPISDHDPNCIDLPFEEPPLGRHRSATRK